MTHYFIIITVITIFYSCSTNTYAFTERNNIYYRPRNIIYRERMWYSAPPKIEMTSYSLGIGRSFTSIKDSDVWNYLLNHDVNESISPIFCIKGELLSKNKRRAAGYDIIIFQHPLKTMVLGFPITYKFRWFSKSFLKQPFSLSLTSNFGPMLGDTGLGIIGGISLEGDFYFEHWIAAFFEYSIKYHSVMVTNQKKELSMPGYFSKGIIFGAKFNV